MIREETDEPISDPGCWGEVVGTKGARTAQAHRDTYTDTTTDE